MECGFKAWLTLLMAGLWLMATGCTPGSPGLLEEQKEPHYRAGKARVNSMDYAGAVEAFQRALEVNPRSASAHFELGWLYDVKVPDPAAAIYHYERYLQLRPRAENADIVRQRILACKQELARAVLPLPITPGLQREFEQLAEENRRLKTELSRWQAYASDLTRALSNAVAAAQAPRAEAPRADSVGPLPGAPRAVAIAPETQVRPGPTASEATPAPGSTAFSSSRVHVVQPGETPTGIARRYGVSLQALLEANPGLEPRRMRVGQRITIPAR
ncbi:LysM peptidoglycan-binding domain-containing protein [Limisphaera sp. VF-2]|jgi:tetratricopeptide (TPR) repeat protein|uniref:LysM peptidoglycan-binding domain-containing protein n=1 Tax=Limisphaera sp. VF-2 TaxID=3400418 RepID=UPI001772AC4C|nr:LysM peptidoglycan-binding domain-containing protein [Limisphaera sp.]